jgi:D-tyrosyl-tRNA(Tyr) deacylase
MKALIQRVKGPTKIVTQSPDLTETIEDSFDGVGLVALLGWLKSDESRSDLAQAEEWIRSRVTGLRVFPDSDGKMNLSLDDYMKENKVTGGILWVPQFTLGGTLESGFRPSFTAAMEPIQAQKRFDIWSQQSVALKSPYAQILGIFGGHMELSFTNWGPITLMLEA